MFLIPFNFDVPGFRRIDGPPRSSYADKSSNTDSKNPTFCEESNRMPSTPFDEFQQTLEKSGVEAALDKLAQTLQAQRNYHDLFDARLMQSRHRLGLNPSQSTTLDELDPPLRDKMEAAYLDACREVGKLLLGQGRIREGWMYLRPVGESNVVAQELAAVEPTDENVEEIIEVALHEGVAPAHGFRLVLGRYGTCNAITMFEQSMRAKPIKQQREVAGILVRHLHADLLANLRSYVEQREGSEPAEKTITELVADRDWLFGQGSYHIDTSHLNSVTRISLLTDDPEVQKLAVDMTEYGRRLDRQFQYQGEEPFADVYPTHAMYLRALLGINIEEALDFFRKKAEETNIEENGTGPAEVYISLLARLGQYDKAIDETVRLIPQGAHTVGYAPSLLELSNSGREYARLARISRERNDLIGFATGLMQERLAKAK